MSSLVARDVTVAYGSAIACILGANGAGKSSFLKCLRGLVPVRSGSVSLDGADITNLKPYDAAAKGLAMSPEGRRLFPELTVHENLCMGAYLRRRDASYRADLDRMLAYFPRLAERLHQPAGRLSGGEQQMVAIGRALMARPRLLLLDEPSLGLAPVVVSQLAAIIATIHRSGITILLVEQNARLALRLASRGYVFVAGRMVRAGSSEELLRDADVESLYLGGGHAPAAGAGPIPEGHPRHSESSVRDSPPPA